MSTLYFIRGVSGAGKSTLAKQLLADGVVQSELSFETLKQKGEL